MTFPLYFASTFDDTPVADVRGAGLSPLHMLYSATEDSVSGKPPWTRGNIKIWDGKAPLVDPASIAYHAKAIDVANVSRVAFDVENYPIATSGQGRVNALVYAEWVKQLKDASVGDVGIYCGTDHDSLNALAPVLEHADTVYATDYEWTRDWNLWQQGTHHGLARVRKHFRGEVVLHLSPYSVGSSGDGKSPMPLDEYVGDDAIKFMLDTALDIADGASWWVLPKSTDPNGKPSSFAQQSEWLKPVAAWVKWNVGT